MTAPLVATAPGNVDALARSLATMAAVIARMPPSWHGGKDTIVIASPQGARVGVGMPGRGIMLTQPLRALGITRPVPYVFDRPVVERWVERCGGRERLAIAGLAALGLITGNHGVLEGLPFMAGAITSFNDIIAARAGGKGEDYWTWKTNVSTNYQQNQWMHALTGTGVPGAFTWSTALSATAPDNSVVGSMLNQFTKPTGGDKSFLLGLGFTCTTISLQAIIMSDLLYECGGFVATSTGSQTAGSAALTRWTSGVGVMASVTPTTQFSNTTSVITMTYTNQAGTGSRSTTGQHINTSNFGSIGRFIPHSGPPAFSLQAGDYGVRSIQTMQLGTILAAGAFSAILHKPLIMIPGATTDIYLEREMTSSLDGLVELVTTSGGELPFLFPIVMSNVSSSGNAHGLQMWLRAVRG